MKVLLDTHAAIWFLEGDDRLNKAARITIESPENQRFLSIASYWEIAIKSSIGKLKIAKPLHEIYQAVTDNDIMILPIVPEHTLAVSNLPFHHKDPFDRMIIAQALVEGMSVISKDQQFAQYPVSTIW